MKRCVIVGQAEIKNYDRIKKYIKDDDYFVYCDAGLKHAEKLGQKPDLIVGDFDSQDNPNLDIETIVLPCEKDDTDTCHAMKVCMERGYTDYLFIGCMGQRLDHTMGNLFLLVMLKENGLKGMILDDYSEMVMFDHDPVCIEDSFSYFSLVSLSDMVDGIYIENAKYPLNDGVIRSSYQYGVSNEVLKGKTARVWAKSGNLLVIKDF